MNQRTTALAHRDQALAELDRGDAERALAIASDALVLLETTGQGESLDSAALLVALAEIDESLGHFDVARVAAGRAAAILAAAFDPEDLDTFWLWCQAEERLAGLDRVGGDVDGAAARLVDLIDRAARILGPVSEAVVSAENALGMAHKYAGHFDDAEAAYGRALRALEASGRRDALAEAGLCHNLGGLAHSRGSPDTGIPHAEQGLALRIEAVGHDHPDTGRDLNALGALYHQAGRLDEARAAYGRALVIFEAAYGLDHFEVAMACANLAVLAGDEGNHMEAETLGLRSLGILETVLGPDDAEVGLTLHNLGVAVAALGRAREAASLFERANRTLAAALPEGHPHLASTRESQQELSLD
jgi:tetratricopeptide (TPR) repeat protein